MKNYLAVDVGGTAIKYAVMDENADISISGETGDSSGHSLGGGSGVSGGGFSGGGVSGGGFGGGGGGSW